ncbi:hypothetical protein GCM10022403_085550 [Streptomyces coacervatus]|uniref:Maltokinase N-terminal cap domain-containing protein n=1 Tax=Streptomyces coacervatus TaxID=647381 RepID=A0ABP7JC95_9ACTN|nr:hypothetical protein [Streptomyces coacervatus]MDF2271953.1 hypothetical protein [Streptomyces coacervatus]
MAKVHPGATLAPHFRDFLPDWVARQEWYAGSGIPSLTPVGYFRFEDPAGEVGIETHLVTDGTALYQIPMTYRDAPLPDTAPGITAPLIATAQHSVLGNRWTYDGLADPVWKSELLRLVRTNSVSEPSGKRGVGPAEARGRRLLHGDVDADSVIIELKRVVTVGAPVEEPGLLGAWPPDGPGAVQVHGCLALLREVTPAHGMPGEDCSADH